MRQGLVAGAILYLAVALSVSPSAQGGQPVSGAEQKGTVTGVLVSEKTGRPITGETVHLFQFFSKADDGTPFEMVKFARDAPSDTTAATGAFKFSDVPVTTLNSRKNKERQKYTLGVGKGQQTLKTADGSLLLFEVKPDGVVDLGRLRVKD